MIKFIAGSQKDGEKILGLGLTAKNIEKLKKGMPMHVNGQEMGLPVNVLIFYGETETEIFEELKKSGIKMDHANIDLKAYKEGKKSP